MSEARCDLSLVLAPEVRELLPGAEKERLLKCCGGSMQPDGYGGWVAVISPKTWAQAAKWERALDQALAYLAIAPDLWPLVEAS
jgi:hypothetical protein